MHNVLGLAWIVKDWRTDAFIVRHAYQFAQPYENVNAYFTSHDGHSFARETIVDEEYNTRFLIDFIQETDEEDSVNIDWRLQVTIEAIDSER